MSNKIIHFASWPAKPILEVHWTNCLKDWNISKEIALDRSA